MDDISTYVQRYLARGWALVPLHAIVNGRCTCGRDCGRSAGKHPRRSEWNAEGSLVHSATFWPGGEWNVGIATGAPSRFWVLDYDPDSAGAEARGLVGDLVRGMLPPHVHTGGGGDHWRFKMPADFEPTNRRGSLPTGLDVRGTGGQVVAPPSVSGKGPYVELADTEPYDPPGWLLDMIRPAARHQRSTREDPPAGWSPPPSRPAGRDGAPESDRGQRYAAGALPTILSELAYATEGTRNDTAFKTAARLIELMNANWLPPGVEGEWTAAGMHSGLGGVELAQVWSSALRHVGAEAATLPPEWTDPTRGEVWTPPVPQGVPPFPSAPPFVGTEAPPSTGVTDPIAEAWERAVGIELGRQQVRAEARRRLALAEFGDRAAARDRLRAEILDAPTLMARPRLQPLVAGVLYRNTLARINGASGHGKSFVTLDLANRVARGMPWAGRPSVAGRVVYLIAEGDEGAAARVAAWYDVHGELGDIGFLPRPVQVTGPEWDLLVEVLAEQPPALVVIDTQARVTVGMDENDATASGEAIASLDRLRVATGACVLVVHHTGRAGGHGRGSTAWTGALHTELGVTKRGDEITVSVGKDKDGRPMDDAIFDLVTVESKPVTQVSGGVVTFHEPPDPFAVTPVVPVWRNPSAVIEIPEGAEGLPGETVGARRARELWLTIRREFNPGDGGTRAEIRTAFQDACWQGRPANTDSFRKAWNRAWSDLIQMGLIAKAYREARFKVVDGPYISNRADDGSVLREPPFGYEVRGSGDSGNGE